MNILSSSSSSTLNSFSTSNKKCNTVIYIIILLIVFIFIYNMFFKENNKQNKDTIIFYVADWCSHCQKIKPFINECKKSKLLNITVKNAEEMNNEEKKQINGFPTAIRNSDNNIAVGEVEIKNLVKQTLNKSNIEGFNANATNNIIFYLDYSSNLINYINLYNNQSGYNLIIKYQNDIQDTDTDFSGNKINSFPVAVDQSNNKIYYGYNEILALLEEEVLKIPIFQDTIIFYLPGWCPHCETIKPYIENLKREQQTNIKIKIKTKYDCSGNIVDKDCMDENEREFINAFPAIKRISDNNIAIGEVEIKNLVSQKLNK